MNRVDLSLSRAVSRCCLKAVVAAFSTHRQSNFSAAAAEQTLPTAEPRGQIF